MRPPRGLGLCVARAQYGQVDFGDLKPRLIVITVSNQIGNRFQT